MPTPASMILRLLLVCIFPWASRCDVEVDDAPVYCKVLLTAAQLLSERRFDLLKDERGQERLPLVYEPDAGEHVLFTAEHLEFGRVVVDDCDCEAEAGHSTIDLDVEELDISLTSLKLAYMYTGGSAHRDGQTGVLSVSGRLRARFELEIDAATNAAKEMHLHVEFTDFNIPAEAEQWLHQARMWLLPSAQALMMRVLQRELREVVSKQLENVRQEGSCLTANEFLKHNAILDFRGQVAPLFTDVYGIGDVELLLEVSDVASVPRSVDCSDWSFNGTRMGMTFSQAAFQADFHWQYRAKTDGSEWGVGWHKAGAGSMKVNAACEVRMDFLRPAAAEVKVYMPDFELFLHEDADDWMYSALHSVFRRQVRAALERFGATIVKLELECVADPTCQLLTRGVQGLDVEVDV
eukprot:TRINITY_DN120977_c0_g1_i1.p1 TRINITY_DN120977_c0_g1~~TRINITY_DN120977_c0_g1_i1.p1  ORF type:complete len:408 (-),score=103.35 TRINITY_DN120977_c0_g1_i1:23-1246(-)